MQSYTEIAKFQIIKARSILKSYPKGQLEEALHAIGTELGLSVSRHVLRRAFLKHGFSSPSEYLGQRTAVRKSAAKSKAKEDFSNLVKAAKNGPVTVESLCNKLDLSPAKLEALLERAQNSGVIIHVENDHVGLRPIVESTNVETISVAPVVGTRFTVGVISDTHLGSKYCLRSQLKDFINEAYKRGARHILHPGDVLDGMYKHGVFEVSHVGLEDQTRDLFETLPQLPGLTYHAIGGNHDDTFSDAVGLDAGQYIQNYFEQRGRRDFKHHGRRSAFVRVGGIVVNLWHPKGSCGYSTDYKVLKKIESYSPGQKPNVLLVGHWHRYVHCTSRGVEGIACPTFQGGGSAFGNSLVGDPAIGGLLLSWELTEHGTMRGFCIERRSYFEKETLHVLDGFVENAA